MLKNAMIVLAAAALMSGCDNNLMKSSSDGGGWGLGGEPKYTHETSAQTILLQLFDGPDHVNRAVSQKNYLTENQTFKDLYVVHQGDHSVLYMGSYPNAKSAHGDLMKVKTFKMANGSQPFAKAIIIAKPGSEDQGPPEWDLKNAKGYYSVLVDIQYDVPQSGYYGRKQRAVMDCRNLRKQGYEAYYFHGPYKSGVAVGSFPKSAIKTVIIQAEHPVTHNKFDVEKKVVVDPKMKKIFQDFPELLICGNTEKNAEVYFDENKRAKRRMVTAEPYPIVIPNAENKKKNKDDQNDNNDRSKPGGRNHNIGLW